MQAWAAPDFSGVWGMVQHDRLGAPSFIPIEPKLNAAGKAATEAFVAKYDVENLEANGSCVEPGMPTVMWGIGGAAMEIVQQPQRITLLSELANQSRRIYLDGRALPEGIPDQRVGFSVGRWEGDTLVIETTNVTEWEAPRWPHSDAFRVTERWFLKDASEITITGLRPDRPPKVEGQVLINEMTMNDAKWYADTDYKVTVVYRRLEDQVMLEDGCAEGIWRTESMHRSIENRHDDLFLNPGAAEVLFQSRYRAMPGRARDYMSFVRTEMYPVMQKAQKDGTFAGLSVTTTVQGGEPGIIALNMHYQNFAPLDGPPPVAKTLGPQGTAAFLQKGAGLITQLDQRILRRLPDLSF